jgi:hypothetical protein
MTNIYNLYLTYHYKLGTNYIHHFCWRLINRSFRALYVYILYTSYIQDNEDIYKFYIQSVRSESLSTLGV